jgi:hypothetical protein
MILQLKISKSFNSSSILLIYHRCSYILDVPHKRYTNTRKNHKDNKMKRSLIVFLAIILGLFVSLTYAQRPTPPDGSRGEPARTTGYCDSWGGSIGYEYITDVDWTVDGNTISLYVDVFITNPAGCSAGTPCPSYDGSPEYVNGWIDFDGDNIWEPSEQVIDLALTGYVNINYNGTMTGYAQATIPPNAVSLTYMRVNLGWATDPNDPCMSSWSWGNVADYAVELESVSADYKVSQITVLNGNPVREIPDGVVWWKEFGCASGINDIEIESFDDYPISTPRNSSVSLRIQTNSCPEGAIPPSWECGWHYSTDTQTLASPNGGMCFIPSSQQTLNVMTPNEVGIYKLVLEVTFTDPNTHETTSETIERRILVTYGKTN